MRRWKVSARNSGGNSPLPSQEGETMRTVIVGASAAGMAAAEAIRKRDPNAEIVMLSDETHPPYYRPLIPYLIYKEKTGEDILRQARLTPSNLDLRLGFRPATSWHRSHNRRTARAHRSTAIG